MDLLTILLIVTGVLIAIALFSWLLRSIIKAIFVVGIIYLLFHIGFLWEAKDLDQTLHLNEYLSPDAYEQIKEKYGLFVEKRDANEVVEPEVIEKKVEGAVTEVVNKAQQEIEQVDKEQLLNDLNQKLEEFDTEVTQQVIEDLKNELQNSSVTVTVTTSRNGEPQDIEGTPDTEVTTNQD